jgi:sortase A
MLVGQGHAPPSFSCNNVFRETMLRTLSYVLVLGGLVVAGFGVHSIWTAKQAEQQAEQQWDQVVESQPVVPAHKVPKGETFARLSISRLGGRWAVIEGADRVELKKGPGHLINTALPGSRGNCVIAGHRDTQFRILRDVEIGESITVESGGHTYIYRVTDRRVVSPSDTRSLYPTLAPTLTLVTCYPFYFVGPAPKRFVVRAKLVS